MKYCIWEAHSPLDLDPNQNAMLFWTSCRSSHRFENGRNSKLNYFKFCPYCSKPIKEEALAYLDEELEIRAEQFEKLKEF